MSNAVVSVMVEEFNDKVHCLTNKKIIVRIQY